MLEKQVGNLITPFPIDDIPERGAVKIGAQIVAKEVDSAMTGLVTGSRDMRCDQYPGVGPEQRHRRLLEFADIDIEGRAAQMPALKRIGKPEDIADIVAFLASADSRWITGAYFDGSGGTGL